MKKLLPFIMSGILALPTTVFAASSVRTLGGSGTYNGVTSVGSGAATRAGSVRSVPSVRVGNTTTTTGTSTQASGTTGATTTANTGTGTRMSMGKYLSGLGTAATKVSTTPSGGAINVPEFERKFQELSDKIDAFDDAGYVVAADLDNYLTSADLDGVLTSSDLDGYLTLDDLSGYEYLTADDMTAFGYIDSGALELALGDYLKSADLNAYAKTADLDDYAKSADLDAYAKKTDILSQESVADIIAGEITNPETGVLKNYATTTSVNQGFETVNGALTNVDDQITGINERLDTLDTNVSQMNVPECEGDEQCLYMYGDDPTSGDKGWKSFSVVDTFVPLSE